MAKRCDLTCRSVQSGNNVSHAVNRTRRRFLPNLQAASLWSETLNTSIPLRVSVYGLRTVEHKGGLDAFLLNTANGKLSPTAMKIKRRIQRVQTAAAA